MAITGVILLHGWPQPLRGISDPSQQVKEAETHTCPQPLVSSSVHTLAQGSFPDALWPESHLTSESVLKGKLIFHERAVTEDPSDTVAFISVYPRASMGASLKAEYLMNQASDKTFVPTVSPLGLLPF